MTAMCRLYINSHDIIDEEKAQLFTSQHLRPSIIVAQVNKNKKWTV